MAHDAADVGQRIFGDQRFLAGFQIDRFERAGVAAAAVDEVQHVARFIEAGGAGGESVVHADLDEIFPAAFAVGLENHFAAVGLVIFVAKRTLLSSSNRKPEYSVFFCSSLCSPVLMLTRYRS